MAGYTLTGTQPLARSSPFGKFPVAQGRARQPDSKFEIGLVVRLNGSVTARPPS